MHKIRTQVRATLGAFATATGVAFASLAAAQEGEAENAESSAEPIEEMVVTGFRGSLAAGLDMKRRETGIVDAIVAEDIAKFPDLNLAESLQRIPGVAIDRQAGEGRRITVRGLSGDFTRVRINGMEVLTTNAGSDAAGGTNRSRSVDFNAFASELFNELVVRKTQSASVEEGSLGANVEMKTPQPFDYGAGFTGTVSAQGFHNTLSSSSLEPRLAGLLSYTDPTETWGALFTVAITDRDIREEGFSTVRFDTGRDFRSVGGMACAADPVPAGCQQVKDAWHPRIPRYGRLEYDQERLGMTGSVQFRPADSTTLSVDGLYSQFKGTRSEEFLEVFMRSNTGAIDITDFTIDDRGVMTRMVADLHEDSQGLVPARSEHRVDRLKTDFYQITANLEHEFSDRLYGNLLGGISRSEFDIPMQATIFFDAANPVTGYTYDFTGSMQTPAIDFGSLDVNDPTAFLFTQFRNRPQLVDNSFDTVQPNLVFELNDRMRLRGGLSWKRFEFDTREARAEGNVSSLPGFNDAVPVTADLAGFVTGYGDGLGASGIDRRWVTPDFNAAVALIDLLNIEPEQRIQDTRNVVERSIGSYAQLDFSFDAGGVPVRGDVGVRYVRTRTSATGFIGEDFATVTRSYDDVLPALNLTAEPVQDFLTRFGIARVMARPSLGNLSPGGQIDAFNGPPFEINMGNPGLDPFRATAIDLAFEWFFAPESLVGVGLFYKDVSSFFTRPASVQTTFSQSGLPASVASPTSPLGILLAAGENPEVLINQIDNGGSANVRGAEFVYQQPFVFLPTPFSDFGFIGNYTYADSNKIIGFSKHSFNATLYYEVARFGARISGAYRDSFLTRSPNQSGAREGRESRGTGSSFHLDMAARFSVTDHFDLTFDAINLTDEFEHLIFDRLELPDVYHHTGRNFLFGARYSF